MDIKDKVSVIKCSDYNYDEVYNAVKEAVKGIGGMEQFIHPGDTVAVKPNLIIMKDPKLCATTNPLVVKAVLSLIIECKGKPFIVESPGGIYKKAYLDATYKTCGIKDIADELNVPINYDLEYESVTFSSNGHKRNSMIVSPILKADVIVNIPKLKTHIMSNYTGGVKNLYGTVPGVFKANYHFKYSDKPEFFSFVTDLTCYLNPAVTIADAVDIMEGDGPTNGNPRKLGLILASKNPFNLDLIGHTIFGFSKEEVLTSKYGEEYNIQPTSVELVDTYGENYKDYLIKNIKKPNIQSSTFDEKIPKFLRKPIKKYLTPYPNFQKNKCKKCGSCVRACPAKAIKMGEDSPVFADKNACIKCYCCHELCPHDAVKLRKLPKLLR